MTRILTLLLALGLVAACTTGDETNPFNRAAEDAGGDGTDGDADGDADGDTPPGDDGEPIESDRVLPPGTASPTPDAGIFRREARDEELGNGFAESVSYDEQNDLFYVDNLGFDGDNFYARDDQVPSLDTATPGSRRDTGRFAVYENTGTVTDPLNSEPINQFAHKGIYAVSMSGSTEFAIVRTGAYQGYGFGGYIYQRNDTDAAGNPVSVTLPTSGQANYQGEYAGLRDFQNRGGLEYVSGDVNMAIDFEDFNDPTAVQGEIVNRRVYAMDGTDITQTIVDALGTGGSALPILSFKVGSGVLDENGEITGEAFSTYVSVDGSGNATIEEYEAGNYYAILSGDNAEEVVGIVVVEGEDPRNENVTFRETGGFIATR
ncbi:hypothetical protein DRV85_04130 [Rhodosalinus halophilus]|uniref:Transferrin-binding protein B C-lobe/N-lobe beta barrel domain-containing protein n=1 Tax=Rhodosalinus halophilus TaxID=2259333 RepID=A0A365UBD9_9RHOB|nr:hypothetical protein [Rhodosalinus halophilus]RBI86627.1 hypothetical protein DRV85_04130 [Rhodosalinus halophilus]